jgi:hypothetical protein
LSTVRDRATGTLTARDVLATWWPLAASWLLMGLELPLVSAVVARLPDPTVSLAAYGGVVFPLSLLIESPIIMMLSASTALSRDRASYGLVRRCMFLAAGTLTVLHALVAFTPLYDVVVGGMLGVPDSVREPARLGLRIMLPWTLSIAYRRFQQGLMIRLGHSWAVGAGTVVRLAANAAVLAAGMALQRVPGSVVGPLAVATGVVCEALFAGLVVRPVVRRELPGRDPAGEPLTLGRFAHFYLPLAATPLLSFLAMPLASGAMSRMPHAIESLAAWPVLNGLAFALRSTGFAMNEVVVALLDRPRAVAALRRFSRGLAVTTTATLLLVAATPLGPLWFEGVSALPPGLAALARTGLWIAVLFPALSVYQSWYQGAIVHSRRTRGVTESMVLYLLTTAVLLAAGIAFRRVSGLHVAILAMVAGNAVQVAWLAVRGRPELRAIELRDSAGAAS